MNPWVPILRFLPVHEISPRYRRSLTPALRLRPSSFIPVRQQSSSPHIELREHGSDRYTNTYATNVDSPPPFPALRSLDKGATLRTEQNSRHSVSTLGKNTLSALPDGATFTSVDSAGTNDRGHVWATVALAFLAHGHTRLNRKDLLLLDPGGSPADIWQTIADRLLQHDLSKLTTFLDATHGETYLSRTRIRHVLQHATEAWSNSKEKDDAPSELQRFVDVFCRLCNRGKSKPLILRNKCVWTMMSYCSTEQIAQIRRAIKLHRVAVHWGTHLHLATHLAKHGYFEEGLESLLEAQRAGAAVNGYSFRSCCSTLLRRSSEQADGLRVCLRIVSTLADLGVELNIPICEIIMLNAVEAGDLKTAFSVYNFLKDRGMRPTEGTLAALLKGCKMNVDDVKMLNDTIQDAIASINVRKSELIACEILHCLALYHCKHNPTTALDALTEAYAQFFDLRPLQQLGLPIARSEQNDEYLTPNQNALNIMIAASIEQTLVHKPFEKGVLPLYKRWRHLVETGNPCCASLATSDYTANIFLMAFTKRPEGLIYATQVVRDMQDSLPIAVGVEQARPTVQTWSIFLHGFSRHKQTEMAEMVLKSMRSVGIEPNPVTWNSLIYGYVRAQDDDGSSAATKRAGASGMIRDRLTHAGLHTPRDRTRVSEELEKASSAPEAGDSLS